MATITRTIEIDTSIKAVLHDGKLSVSVSATVPYGNGRTATHTEPIAMKADSDLEKALTAVLEAHQEHVVSLAEQGASEALTVAARRKEL